jgi:hypothetical protein
LLALFGVIVILIAQIIIVILCTKCKILVSFSAKGEKGAQYARRSYFRRLVDAQIR